MSHTFNPFEPFDAESRYTDDVRLDVISGVWAHYHDMTAINFPVPVPDAEDRGGVLLCGIVRRKEGDQKDLAHVQIWNLMEAAVRMWWTAWWFPDTLYISNARTYDDPITGDVHWQLSIQCPADAKSLPIPPGVVTFTAKLTKKGQDLVERCGHDQNAIADALRDMAADHDKPNEQ